MKEKKLRSLKTITFSLSYAVRELYRQYKARKILREVSKIARAAVKKQGLTPEDFGMSSEDI